MKYVSMMVLMIVANVVSAEGAQQPAEQDKRPVIVKKKRNYKPHDSSFGKMIQETSCRDASGRISPFEAGKCNKKTEGR